MGLLLLTLVMTQATQPDAGPVVVPPALLAPVQAAYPPQLADAGVAGTVVLELDVGADGGVLEAKVVQSAGQPAFDEAAVEALRQARFSPALVDGVPTAVRLQYRYEFFLTAQAVEVEAAADGGQRPVRFSGRLLERGTRDPLAFAQVTVGELELIADAQGTFSTEEVSPGRQQVTVVSPDHERYQVEETFAAGQETQVTYYVRRKVYGAFESVVRGKKEKREVAQVTLKQEEIRLIPGSNGDAFRVVQNLPGVARAPFGIGLLIVRGGKQWDTRTYIDEIQVPQLFHFGGITSTFNSWFLDNISFQPGNFNADFGRAIGGLVQGTVRTPGEKGWHGYADVNLIDASAAVEGRIAPDWTFSVSARRSYIDAVLPAVLGLIPGASSAISFTVAPRYYDYQARLEWRPGGGKNRVYLGFFGSNDQLVATLPNPAIDPEGRGEFGTSVAYNRLAAGIDWTLGPGVDFRSRSAVGLDVVGFTLGSDIFARSSLFPVTSRNTLSFDLPGLRSTLSAGVDLLFLPYTVDVQSPPAAPPNQVPDPFASRQLRAERATIFSFEPGLFVDVLVKPVDNLRILAGVRADYNSQMNDAWVNPRFSVQWAVIPQLTAKGAVGIYHQPPDFRLGQLSPTFGNPNLLPEGARQYMVGLEARFTEFLGLDVQLYYKDLFWQARSTVPAASTSQGQDLSMPELRERYTSLGTGRSFGAEILLRHNLSRNFFGWISYSLSRTERDFRGQTEFGLSQWDQPHNLVVVASYKLPLDFIVGARLRYTSGPLVTPVTGSIYDANGNYFFPLQGRAFSRRLPDFFQLDLRVDKRFVFDTWMLQLYVDVQNVTNARNVEQVIYSFDYSQEAFLTGLPILPVLGVRAEW